MGLKYDPLVEMWTLYVLGSILVFLRVACRLKMVGIHNFKPDDYLIWVSWVSHYPYSLASRRSADWYSLMRR